MELLLSRRSVRKYTGQEVSKELIEKLVKSAMYAPSAGNQQAWQYIVITDKSLLVKIAEIHPYGKMLTSASVAILVCGDTGLESKQGYWPVDCSASTENLLLAAHGLGLGAVWLGIHPRPEREQSMTELFSLPENIKPFSLVSVGYPTEQKPIPERYKPERVHWNGW